MASDKFMNAAWMARGPTKNWLNKHAVTIAGCFWTSSAVALASAKLHKREPGTWYDSIGGSIITIGEVTAMTLGSFWKYAGNFATTAFITGVCIERWPEIVSNPFLALGMFGLVVANTPIMLEFRLKEPAQQTLEQLRIQREFADKQPWVLERALDAKETFLWCYANPRTTSWGINFSYLAISIESDFLKNHRHMPSWLTEFYAGQVCGNRIAPLSETKPGLPTLTLKSDPAKLES